MGNGLTRRTGLRAYVNFYLRVLSGWAHLASLYVLVLEQGQHAFAFPRECLGLPYLRDESH